jgi:cyclophilin family peptidyl-prolyl cis-trans isomerase/HEAT repeat protein
MIALIATVSCSNPEAIVNKFSDPVFKEIADLKDRRIADSLYPFLSHEKDSYRKEAALAFASLQDSAAVEELGKLLLSDKDTSIRRLAAFAIGQTPAQRSQQILESAILKETEDAMLNEILEAYGKVTAKWQPISEDVNHQSLGPGKAWSLYRAGLNNKVDTLYNKHASELLNSRNNYSTRLGAAHFFSRGSKNYKKYVSVLVRSALSDPSVDIQLASISALRKIKNDSVYQTLDRILNDKGDYRLRVNSIRSLQSFPFEKIKDHLFKGLADKNVNVGIAASEVIKNTLTENFWIEVANQVSDIKNWRIQANLYQAILKVKPNETIINEIKKLYGGAQNVYQKAALLESLQEAPTSFSFIEKELLKADTPVIRTSAVTALVAMNKKKSFPASLYERMTKLYVEAFKTNDLAVIGIISAALADSTLGYRNRVRDFTFLYEARKKLSLPKDNEALQPLEEAIAYFEKRKVKQSIKNEFNHPIDWDLVKSIPRNQVAVIKTAKGNISVRLLVEEAPGSVANFVSLVNKNYFDHKFFHRVVPNFVIQAGCARGDGWGSEGYSIRSEFSPRKYTTGSVGMASAGKDTEGTQWFITHSPTPHLDGHYTIFALVDSGMDVVHKIEVGDEIIDIELMIEQR